MRENRLYGSEGGAAKAVPTPISNFPPQTTTLGFAALTASLLRGGGFKNETPDQGAGISTG